MSTLKTITAGIILGLPVDQQRMWCLQAMKAVTRGNQLCKFADDTYMIIPASNVDSRTAEVENIEEWEWINNLTLKRSKTKEIVFTDSRRRHKFVSPPPNAYIVRAMSV
jgi:hypothetical protein